ncbi:MAG: outer membrane receptor for ferrienterochelin and colicins [Bacteroidia bacterium]|jgi:outer membrane receptor for ferrienterochelin and colicins
MKNIIMLVAIQALIISNVLGQSLNGHVHEEGEHGHGPLTGASVVWLGTTVGTATNVNGEFSISKPDALPAKLIVSFVGYTSDTLLVSDLNKEIEIHLEPSVQLGTVTVSERREGSAFKLLDPVISESINSQELAKAACCNLSESFETNASVDVVFTDAVSGAKKIQMLGLDGVYTQIQAENVPLIRGLSSNYGMGFVPGTWIESIQIIKGPGSVSNGYESMVGQINLEYFKPDQAEKLFVNVYGNAGGRVEANIQSGHVFNEKVGMNINAHASGIFRENDGNKDGFVDIPRSQQYNLFNRWSFTGKNIMGQIVLHGLYDNKVGGQVGFKPEQGIQVTGPYGIEITNRLANIHTKTGYIVPNEEDMSVALITNWRYHDQNSYFGVKNYSGVQKSTNSTLIFLKGWKEDKHTLKMGTSFNYDNFQESYNDSAFGRQEIVPGAFAEYTFRIKQKFSAVAGFRYDRNSKYGSFYTPRLHLKYNPTDKTVLRLTGGRGYRATNVFTESSSLMASSRIVNIVEELKAEISWNYGISASHQFKLFGRQASVYTSFYRTDFENQVIVDLDADAQTANVYNLNGTSYSNSLQAEFGIEPVKRFQFKTAYKWNDVHMTTGGALRRKALVKQHKFLTTFSYATNFNKWQFDLSIHVHGPARIPSTATNPLEYQLASQSPWHATINAQITKRFKWFELYAGAENLTNFRQKNPIIAANDPYGEFFDASLVWGATMGINPYLGLRYKLK